MMLVAILTRTRKTLQCRTMNKKEIQMKTLGVLLFDQFELLDVAGPVEMFAYLLEEIQIVFVAEEQKLIKSAQCLSVMTDVSLDHAPAIDYLFVPGGMGTRTEVNNPKLISWIKTRAEQAELVLGVCTGAALLARAGVLDHRKATSNKLAFDWVMTQGPHTDWIRRARWVDDGKVITSSGVAAGTDMSLYVIGRLFGEAIRDALIQKTEYIYHQDPHLDPFA